MKKILTLLAICGMAFALDAQPDKIAQVMKGELKEAYASWWCFDAEDATQSLQEAIDSKVPKLIIDKMPSSWIVGSTLKLVSNQEIVLEEGVELLAKKGAFKGISDCLVRIDLLENIILRGEGKGATLRMRKADYHTDEYRKAEWRHAVCIRSSKNIQLFNLNLVESGGDGIYLGMAKDSTPPTDIVIRDVVCDGNNRQGISIIASVNLLIENCKLINTRGTAPAAGIDFEPNRPNEPLRNILVRNCTLYNNAGDGFHFYLAKMNAESGPMDITIDNCTSSNEGLSCFRFLIANGSTRTMQGRLLVQNCTFDNCPMHMSVKGTSAIGFKTTFENVVVKNIGQKNPSWSPLEIGGAPNDEEPSGNIHFKNFKIYDTVERKPLMISQAGMVGGLENISGSITYIVGDKTTEIPFTNEWAKENYPPKSVFKAPLYDMEGVSFAPLSDHFEMTEFSHISLRHRSKFLFYGNQGEDLRFTLYFGQLGKYESKDAPVTFFFPSGKKQILEPIPFKQSKDYVIEKLPETGLYTLTVNCGANWSYVARANRPTLIHAVCGESDFCKAEGNIYFYVPPRTPSFCVNFFGEGQEGLKVTIFDEEGKQVWQKDDISMVEQFWDDKEIAQKGGIYHAFIEKPTHLATLEDYLIQIYGIPPYIALAPNMLMKPTK